jgi:hypothetical protein
MEGFQEQGAKENFFTYQEVGEGYRKLYDLHSMSNVIAHSASHPDMWSIGGKKQVIVPR